MSRNWSVDNVCTVLCLFSALIGLCCLVNSLCWVLYYHITSSRCYRYSRGGWTDCCAGTGDCLWMQRTQLDWGGCRGGKYTHSCCVIIRLIIILNDFRSTLTMIRMESQQSWLPTSSLRCSVSCQESSTTLLLLVTLTFSVT